MIHDYVASKESTQNVLVELTVPTGSCPSTRILRVYEPSTIFLLEPFLNLTRTKESHGVAPTSSVWRALLGLGRGGIGRNGSKALSHSALMTMAVPAPPGEKIIIAQL